MDCSYFACTVCTKPYWIIKRQPVVYPCGHGICQVCDSRLEDRRCPFCKKRLTENGSKNICFVNMLT
jgi:hypothetical protein